jgi:hypothetical protein
MSLKIGSIIKSGMELFNYIIPWFDLSLNQTIPEERKRRNQNLQNL